MGGHPCGRCRENDSDFIRHHKYGPSICQKCSDQLETIEANERIALSIAAAGSPNPTLRQLYAGQAMQGIVQHRAMLVPSMSEDPRDVAYKKKVIGEIAAVAFEVADAMIAVDVKRPNHNEVAAEIVGAIVADLQTMAEWDQLGPGDKARFANEWRRMAAEAIEGKAGGGL